MADESTRSPALVADVLPDTLCLMPIPHRPFFPGQIQPVVVNAGEWESTLRRAARRVKVNRLFLPKANQKDFEELPEYLQEGLDVTFVDHFTQIYGSLFSS